MVRESLDSLSANGAPEAYRILDPACGAGAFLIPAFDELSARTSAHAATAKRSGRAAGDGRGPLSSAGRLEVVRRQLFGVDIDPAAVDQLRKTLFDKVGAAGNLAESAWSVLEENIRCGNALTGAGFDALPPSGSARPAGKLRTRPRDGMHDLDWGEAFPEAAAARGFDLVIGNPPYLRERDARALFEQLARTRLGRQWREARMDLWYYFAHRGLDLLRPGGVLSFVVNSYWTASRGARRLIGRLERESQLEMIELLGNQPLFARVAGRHLVFRARKVALPTDGPLAAEGAADRELMPERRGGLCRIITVPPESANKDADSEKRSPAILGEYHVPHAELFHGNRLVLAPPDRLQGIRDRTVPLGQLFDTRQGMAENPPTINRRTEREFAGRYKAGEGVFVLRDDEIRQLDPTRSERALLRPYFDTVELGRYMLPEEPTRQVLYLTRTTAPTLEGFPRVAAHLRRFRPILQRRRETREGKCAWWHLHWPREESIFLKPRILSVQMGRRPQFVYAERPTFVGFSVNVILFAKAEAPSLAALTGLLNSSVALDWFARHPTRRGVHLEINGHVLREFPAPPANETLDRSLAALVRRRQALGDAPDVARDLEREIDRIAGEWYGVDPR
jgi:SAM-dependent methyltransferase